MGYILAWAELKDSVIFTSILDRSQEPWLRHTIKVVDGTFCMYHQIRFDSIRKVFVVRKVSGIFFFFKCVSCQIGDRKFWGQLMVTQFDLLKGNSCVHHEVEKIYIQLFMHVILAMHVGMSVNHLIHMPIVQNYCMTHLP